MNGFRQGITRIKGLSDRRRLPRLGIIRLGIKLKSQKTGNEYPKETDYFVCPPEVQEVYGSEPKELDVMVPLNDPDAVFPMAYKHYGSSRGLICSGDGEKAYRVNTDTGEMQQIECPCGLLEQGKCKQSATFMFMIPKVSLGGIYQVRTSSFNSIIDIQSGLDFIQALIGRFAMIPLKLRRIETQTHHEGKKQHHYTMQIIFPGNIDTINQLKDDTERILAHPQYALPAPLDENPEFEPVDIVVADEEESTNPIDIINKLKKSMDEMETKKELEDFHTQKYEIVASFTFELQQEYMDHLRATIEKISLPETLSVDDRFHKEFLLHKHEAKRTKIIKGVTLLAKELNTTEEEVKRGALEDSNMFMAEVNRITKELPEELPDEFKTETDTEPPIEGEGATTTQEGQDSGSYKLGSNYNSGVGDSPSDTERKVIELKEILAGLPREGIQEAFQGMKNQISRLPMESQAQVREERDRLLEK